jgi:uncharacterized membrane protein (UPF0127 family)
MNKKYWFVIGIVILVLISIIITNRDKSNDQLKDLEIKEVCFEKNCFQVEIADTDEKRERGLMFREELCSDCGMLFVYDEEVKSKFWMKNTLIPLDIIWLDSDLKVIHVANAVPCVTEECGLYGPSSEKSQYVLEVNSGVAKNIGLEKGSILKAQ